MTTTEIATKICKCGTEFRPQYRGTLLISRSCPDCRYKQALAVRVAQLNVSKIRDVESANLPIKQVSAKQSVKNAELTKIKKSLPSNCIIPDCDCKGIDLCHLLAKSLYPEYYTKEENLVRMCRIHHNLFDDCKEFRQKQTFLFNQVAEFDEMAANKYFDYADHIRAGSK